MTGAGALATMVLAGALTAQGGGDRRGPGDRMGRGGPMLGTQIEAALEHGETLGLTEDQRTLLRELREEVAAAEETLETRRAEMREMARSGSSRSEMRDRMRTLRDEMQETMRPYGDRWQEIVTDAQREQLRALVRPARRDTARRRGGQLARRDLARACRRRAGRRA